MDSIVELENVTRLYGTVIGVNDITLTLEPGAYGLLGPNGAGKTTLLNLMTGQLSPTIGKVRMLGHSPRNNPQFLSEIGYLPGSEGMYSNVSAIDWVKYLVELQGFGRLEARDIAQQALDRVGMTDHMHRKIADYSRGMRQRTRLAQAIAHRPKLLILDEPFSGLDPIARFQMSELLREWIAEGQSVILATHVLHEIEAITSSFLLICGGRLLASGSTNDINELMADVPSEVRLKTSKPNDVAAVLIQEDLVDSVRLDGTGYVYAATRKSLKLYQFVTKAVAAGQFQVTEVRSVDESMQQVFDSLMKMHRGEL
jgi:ABC-2 type transport system ATP-binding protein